jgi:hypothetical protein
MKCQCHKCSNIRIEQYLKDNNFDAVINESLHFRACPICGNKRCPKTYDHELDCTNSNEPGQIEAIYKSLG